MAEQFTQLDILTDAERAAIEQPGLGQRAKTLLAVAELTTALGVSGDIKQALLDRVRGMNGQEARVLRKNIGRLGNFVEGLLPSDDHAESDDRLGIGAEDVQPENVATEESDTETDSAAAEGYVFDLQAVRSWYSTINKKTSSEWLTMPEQASDIDPDEVLGLIELDARSNTKPTYAAQIVDKMLVAVGPDAPNNQSAHSFKFLRTNRIAEYLDKLETESIEPTTSISPTESEAPVVALESKKMEDEPAHVRIAQRYEELFGFDSAEATAFRCLIDPDNRGEMTPNKHRVITKIRGRIEEVLGSVHAIRAELTPAQTIRIANLLGFFIKEKNIGEQPPLELSQQLKRVENLAERHAQITNLHQGLDKLADLLGDEQLDAVAGEVLALPVPKPLQVKIVDGKATLA